MTRNQSMLTRVSSLAIAAVLATSAAAQSFLGTPTVTFGTVNISEAPSTTDLDVSSATAVIDWTPDDNAVGNFGAIAFQQSGTSALFHSLTDFAVLNRINVADPTRLVSLDGAMLSQVNGQTGGSIFFYSPSGFVIGSNAVINVGSLVLSASPIAVDGNGGFINGTTVTFNQAVNPNAAVHTVAGSQLNAHGSGSYIALVAPQITHQGIIRTDGAAALVAAEAATINFSPDGLFDIQVTIGTDAATGIHVDGGTIGRNDLADGGNHHAYLVAVAKNDAVTMLINNGGSIGFETATSALVEDNAVVLSGGFDVFSGFVSTSSGTSTVDLTVNNAAFSTDTIAHVSGPATINSANGPTSFGGDLSLTSGGNALIDALNGSPLTIAGDLSVTAFAPLPGGGRTGQQVLLRAQGSSTLTIGGNVYLDADSFGTEAQGDGLNGANATGGTVRVQATNSGTVDIAGSLDMTADGHGGDNFYSNGGGGNGTGGLAHIQASGGGTVNVDGVVFASADGFGGSAGECSGCLITGGTGTGGTVNAEAGQLAGNSINFGSNVTLSAAGFGGAGDAGGGNGLGGIASLGASDGAIVNVLGDTMVDASGFGGFGFGSVGGNGTGGRATISTFGTAGSLIDLIGDVFVIADGQGGDAGDSGSAGQGGNGTGGQATVSADLGTIHAHNILSVAAQSYGGSISFGTGTAGDGIAMLTGPAITEALLFSGAGTLIVDGLTAVAANANGGDGGFEGGNGGDAVAGRATIHAGNRDDGTSVIQLAAVAAIADAEGGAGGDGPGGTNGGDGGDGGSATAGRAVVTAAAGSGDLTAGATILSASATGGAGGSGGSGDGGSGGNGGDGGSATGGFINVGTESGNVNFAQAANNGTATYTTIIAAAAATGGRGGDGGFGAPNGIGGNGGDAFGGLSALLVRGSEVIVGDVNLDSSAFGGDGGISPTAPTGDGGDATTGTVGVLVTNRLNLPLQRGTLTAGNITGFATAIGGIGGLGDGLSLAVGGNLFGVLNSDATIDSVSLVTQADAYDSGATNASASYIELQNGTVDISGNFVFQTPGPVAMYADGATLDAAQIVVDADNFIHDDTVPAPVTIGTFSANNIFLTTGQDLIVDGHMVSLNGLGFTAPGLIDFDNVTSTNGPLALNAGTTVTAGNLSAGALVAVTAGGDIAVGNVTAIGAQAVFQSTSGGIATGNIGAAAFIGLNALTGITTGNLNAGDLVFGQADGAIQTGNIVAGTSISLFSSSSTLTLGDLDATTSIDLDAAGNILFGDVVAGDFDFDSGGTVTGGDIIAGTHAGGDADGAVTLGDISVGIQLAGGPSEDGFAVGIASATSINVGNVEADEAIGFATLGSLTTGNLNAGTDVLAMVGGNMSFGSITTPGTGRTYLADAQMFLDAGGPDDFDPSLVFNADPLATGGSITIAGPVSTGSFQAAAGTNFSTMAINASTIDASAGGTAMLNGLWQASDIHLWSNDIDIGAAAGIDAGTTGDITLVSTNATQTLIGDGLTGTGYQLTNAEFGRLSAGSLAIAARGDASAAIDMLIGDLSITGPLAGSTIESPTGSVLFFTGDPATETAGGVIRITGDLVATGFTDTNAIEFYTGRFELDAATGLLEITENGTDLGGELFIEADRVHVASGTILDQLAVDPQYSGYQDDLNAPAAVQRPDGVIRAGGIEVLSNGPLAVLVQNTGTAQTPAGFLTFADGPLFNESEPPAGPIELIINGQLITEAGTLAGVDVRDFLIDESNISLFTENSTINGCALSGLCGSIFGEDPGFTPTPGIQDEITLITDDPLPPPEFGNEDFIDDNDEDTDEGETSPIPPPDPLFDTSELSDASGTEGPGAGTTMRSNPGLTRPGDVDDPVSGSGNPALMETPPPSSNEEKQP